MALTAEQRARINQKIEEIQATYSKTILDVLRETNKVRLKGKGKTQPHPIIDRHSIRWTLVWKEDKISFDLNIVVNVDDDGRQAKITKVWVHRHAVTDFDYEGHTPTTRMRRLTSLSIAEIKEAIEIELR